MPTLHRYSVHPALPDRLASLADLAYNLRWTWDHDTVSLFRRLDAEQWEAAGHNPVLLLRRVSQHRLDEAAGDEAFVAHLERVCAAYRDYRQQKGWFRRQFPDAGDLRIAYFCMEFGMTEGLPIYSGGLGVLAGDHLKTASDLDLPLVAVGLLYQKGYFTQYLSADGWQLERYDYNDFAALPIKPALDGAGGQVTITLDLAGREVAVRVWQVQVGRITLYLLDTSVPTNDPKDREVTAELYGGGPEERLRQEIVLGIGGIRALTAMGVRPQVCHMNEGHSAFLSLERVRELMRDAGLDYGTARQVTGAGTLFTTHTPVPAGFDLFPADLMGRYFETYIKDLGFTMEQLMARGRVHPQDAAEPFNVAALAIRHSPRRNAVSRLHRRVTARMLRESWPDWPDSDIPVASVTNGAHVQGWVAGEMAALFDRYLGLRWRDDPADAAVWERIARIPDEELWRTHGRQRERLVSYARTQFESQLARRGALPRERQLASEVLGSDVLTIGFARRFATYKRATLLLSQIDRLKAILLDEARPVQLIFAGKAHPRDDAGKELIRQIVHFAQQEGLRRRIVFLEDYDLSKARVLVQGADVWLNTPRRPMEASGTSGMKALMNGVLNLSVLDGWWAEGYREGVGWAIGTGEEYNDWEMQDRVESLALYSILEHQVIPLFYDRGADGLPRGWLAMMKDSMRTLIPAFSSTRMVKEYVTRFYVPAATQYAELAAEEFKRGRELAAWRARVNEAWKDVAVESVTDSGAGDVPVGGLLSVEAKVRLGSLTPRDVAVQVYHGLVSPTGRITGGVAVPMDRVAEEPGSVHVYRGAITTAVSGEHAFSVRVVPSQEGVLIPNEMALISWE